VVTAVPVGIIETQRLFAPFLWQVFSEAGFTVVASMEEVSADELGRSEPEVVLVDVDFLAEDAIDALRRLRALLPSATICAYTEHVDDDAATAFRRSGADTLISKLSSPAELIDSVERARYLAARDARPTTNDNNRS
jgi:DNA-binding NarL/FixJ family response regulator